MGVPPTSERLSPCNSRIVTVPELVGVQLIVAGVPATKERPDPGILKGLAPLEDCAEARAARAATKTEQSEKRMLDRNIMYIRSQRGAAAVNKSAVKVLKERLSK
jgi:hypothetical protein